MIQINGFYVRLYLTVSFNDVANGFLGLIFYFLQELNGKFLQKRLS